MVGQQRETVLEWGGVGREVWDKVKKEEAGGGG